MERMEKLLEEQNALLQKQNEILRAGFDSLIYTQSFLVHGQKQLDIFESLKEFRSISRDKK